MERVDGYVTVFSVPIEVIGVRSAWNIAREIVDNAEDDVHENCEPVRFLVQRTSVTLDILLAQDVADAITLHGLRSLVQAYLRLYGDE